MNSDDKVCLAERVKQLEQEKSSLQLTLARTEEELRRARQTLAERTPAGFGDLRCSEEQYRRFVETANEGIWAMDRDHRTTFVNAKMAEMLGYLSEEIIGLPVEHFIFPEDMDDHLSRMEYRHTCGGSSYERRFRRKDGGEFWCFVSATALYDEQGAFAGSFAMFTDISERKRAEKALQESESAMQAVLEAATEAVFLMAVDGTVVIANKSMAEIVGRRVDELAGCFIYDLLPPSVASARREQVDKVIRTGRHTTFVDQRYGRWFESSLYPIFDMQGRVFRLAVFGRDVTDRKQTEESLKKSEALLRLTQGMARVGGWEWDVVEQSMTWTDEVYRIHEFSRTDCQGADQSLVRRSLACYAPEDRDAVQAAFQRCVTAGEPYDMECSFMTAKGRRLWVRTRAHAEWQWGKVVRVVGNFMDVTDRKNMELALRESEERFRFTFSRSPVGAAIVATDYTFLQANESFCHFIGYTENELRQLTFADVTHPESRKADLEQVSRLLTGELSRYETDKRYIHKDGHTVWGRVAVSLVRNSEKKPLYYLPIVQDITERKRAEEALQESEGRLKSIFLAAPVGIGLTCNRIITDANDTLCRMTGYERQDLLGKSARMLYADDSEFEFVGREKYKQIMERGTGTVETRWVRRDGTVITVILSSTPLYPGDFSRGVTFTALDISELRNSIREKEVLLREVHHRVKNNLAAIIALLEMQQKGISDTEAVSSLQDLAGRIKSMALVHERLYRSDNLARIDFEDYLKPLISHLRTTFGVPAPVRCDIDATGIELGLDLAIPCALIVNELVTNAIKHAFPLGKPGPGSEACDIRIAVKIEGDECTLSVADNGIGLPPDLDWTSFSSLGLRLVRMLGEHQLGGKIHLDRTEGTRFTLRFAYRGARLNHGR